MTAFVLGNGLSRAAVEPETLKNHGRVYGCNALYRTFVPDVLVATDAPIAREIQQSGYAQRHRFYTRRPLGNLGACTIPSQYFGHSSGPVAVALAALDNHDPIYLLGFDLGPDAQGQFNNVYAGTQFYKPHGAGATFAGNWCRQLSKIFQDFCVRNFVRVVGPTSAHIPEFDGVRNLVSMPMAQFCTFINTGKE